MVVLQSRYLPRGRAAAQAVEAALDASGLDGARMKYRELQTHNPDQLFFSEASFNALGYKLLGQGKFAEAIAVFTWNVEAYPQSANAFDSLGEACMKGGDRERAIANYQKSLLLNPFNSNGREMLKILQAKQNDD